MIINIIIQIKLVGNAKRVSIARAIVNNPDIIFADEPTGNLDYSNGLVVMDILKV